MLSRNLFDGSPRVQLSLDLQTMAGAMPTADIAVRAGVDWRKWGRRSSLARASTR